MAFVKGRKKQGGRKKGTPNKVTVQVREAMELAFEGLGGVSALKTWGKDNLAAFYQMWIKLLAKHIEITGAGGKDLVPQKPFDRPEIEAMFDVLRRARFGTHAVTHENNGKKDNGQN